MGCNSLNRISTDFLFIRSYSKHRVFVTKEKIFMLLKLIYPFLLILLACSQCFGGTLRFQHIKIEESYGFGPFNGSGIGATRSIAQDKEGFLWFGGENGLAKYDGRKFKIFTHDPGSLRSLSNNYISDLHVDSDGDMWIATHSGINLYNPVLDEFIRFPDDHALGVLNSVSIICFVEDKQGKLFIASNEGISIYDPDRELLTHFSPSDEIEEALKNNGVFTIFIDSKDNLWVGTQGWGLLKFNLQTNEIVKYVHQPDDITSISSNTVTAIEEDRSGALWFGTQGGGLNRFDPKAELFKRYYGKWDASLGSSGLSIPNIYVDSHDLLWISIVGVGVAYYNSETDEFSIQKYSKFDPYSIGGFTVLGIYEDGNSDMWFGTFPSGVEYWDRSSSHIDAYYWKANKDNWLNNSAILAFYDAEPNKIWVGTEQGLNLFDIKLKKFDNSHPIFSKGDRLNHDPVLTLEEDDRNNLWIGTWADGLYKYNKTSGELSHYHPDPKAPDSLNSEYIWKILFDSQKRLWVATETGGLSLYDYDNDSFVRVKTVASNNLKNRAEFAWPIFEDRHGRIWLSSERKIEYLDKDATDFKSFTRFEVELGVDTRVLKIYEDSHGNLWFGTHDNGIIVLDGLSRRLIQLTMDNGLPSNSVASIIEANNGSIWATTSNGFAQIDHRNFSIRSYGKDDGFVGSQSIRDAAYKDSSGRLYLGTTEGFNVFYPDTLKYNSFVPPVVFTDFKIFNRSVDIGVNGSPLKAHINHVNKVVLSDQQSSFSIDFSALSYTYPLLNQYAYMLEGFDNDWIFTQGESSVTYTNLDPGTYTFYLKGSNNDSVWNEKIKKLKIEIRPPLWSTWWAYLIYFIVIGGFLYAILNARTRRIELEQQKKINNELIHFDQVKADFIANASHELRTPLNGIIGLTEALTHENVNPHASREKLLSISKSGKRLSNLISELIDFSVLTMENSELNRAALDLNDVIQNVVDSMQFLVEGKSVVLESRLTKPLPPVYADKERVAKLLTSLVDNSIKFSDRGVVTVSSTFDDDHVSVTVSDDGRGISRQQQKTLYDLFYHSDNVSFRHEQGIGIGLALAVKIVKLHKGELLVVPRDSGGTEFTFTLPVYKNVKHDSVKPETPKKEKKSNINAGEDCGDTHKILIVDDDPVNRMVLRGLLEIRGYLVVEAEDGFSALDALTNEEGIELIILDIMMPQMSGYEVAVRIRDQYSKEELPIIFLSALDQSRDIEEGMNSGGNAYLTKPLSKVELFSCVDEYLNV